MTNLILADLLDESLRLVVLAALIVGSVTSLLVTLQTEPSTNQKPFTYQILLLLLVIQFPIADFILNFAQLFGVSLSFSIMDSLRNVQNFTVRFYDNWSLMLVAILIWLNRNDLKNLNFDSNLAIVALAVSIVYCRDHFFPSGWIVAGIAAGMLYKRKEYEFAELARGSGRIVIIVLIGYVIGLVYVSYFLSIRQTALRIWFEMSSAVSLTLVEEIVFRGLLWMFLKNLNWSDFKIISLQAILFWLFHAYHMFTEPFLFWILIPIISILLGIIVWRSKSLFPSMVTHGLFNSLWSLL